MNSQKMWLNKKAIDTMNITDSSIHGLSVYKCIVFFIGYKHFVVFFDPATVMNQA